MRKTIRAIIVLLVSIMLMAAGLVWSAEAPKGSVRDINPVKVPDAKPPVSTKSGAEKIKETIQIENGTVKDPITGLVWLKNANCSQFGQMTWDQAMAAAKSLKSGICGLKDGSIAGQWRLSTIDELKQRYNNPQGFDNFQPAGYWSSSTVAGTNDFAWGFGIYFGQMNGNPKSSPGFVWPVRSGQ